MRITFRRLTELIADVRSGRDLRTGFEDAIQLDSVLLIEGAQRIRGTRRPPFKKRPFNFALKLRLGGLTHRLSFVTVGPLHAAGR